MPDQGAYLHCRKCVQEKIDGKRHGTLGTHYEVSLLGNRLTVACREHGRISEFRVVNDDEPEGRSAS